MRNHSVPIIKRRGFLRDVSCLRPLAAFACGAIALTCAGEAAAAYRQVQGAHVEVSRAASHWHRRPHGWWRGHPWFATYRGLRPGHYFVPGHGYVPVPRAYYGRRWLVGHVVPVPLRRYHVHDLAFYRLGPPPRGHVWLYVDNNIVLMRVATGVIVNVIYRIW